MRLRSLLPMLCCVLVLGCDLTGTRAPTAPQAVASIVLDAGAATLPVGTTQTIVAVVRNADGQTLAGRTVTWLSSDSSRATVSALGVVTAIAPGNVTITASAEGKSASVGIGVSALPLCTTGNVPALAVGAVFVLGTTQRAQLCVPGAGSAAEYALVLFNPDTVAADTRSVTLSSVTSATSVADAAVASLTGPAFGQQFASASTVAAEPERTFASDEGFLIAQAQRFAGMRAQNAAPRIAAVGNGSLARSASVPEEGETVYLNANSDFSTCARRFDHPARVVKVLRNTIVYVDLFAPAGGYTDSEMIAQATLFDTLAYPLDTLNFGAPSDIDSNGRIGIFFTPAVNGSATNTQNYLGYVAYRDLVSRDRCLSSNEAEIFYIAVPDITALYNGFYQSKASLLAGMPAILTHELQHVINASKKDRLEVAWLSEGLSHVAEELLYYKRAGLQPRSNLPIPTDATSSQAYTELMQANHSRVFGYLAAPETNSPYALNDLSATRGAAWQLLRYAADRKGGDETATWRALVSSTVTGRANFTSVFGDMTSVVRDWTVAQLTDDAVSGVSPLFTHPSWNLRSFFAPSRAGAAAFPLRVRPLPASPTTVTLNGGGAAYYAFTVGATGLVTVRGPTANASSSVDMMLVRTK